jgi:hypothetical protein
VQNIIAIEADLKSHLEKIGMIAGRKDRPVDILLPMFYVDQDPYLDSMITHPLQPTFIDRAAGKSLSQPRNTPTTRSVAVMACASSS